MCADTDRVVLVLFTYSSISRGFNSKCRYAASLSLIILQDVIPRFCGGDCSSREPWGTTDGGVAAASVSIGQIFGRFSVRWPRNHSWVCHNVLVVMLNWLKRRTSTHLTQLNYLLSPSRPGRTVYNQNNMSARWFLWICALAS